MKPLPGIEREQFVLQLSSAVMAARAEETHLGLLLIDLTNLASINHHHGYETGDLVLLTAYNQLLELSKLPGAIFRLGSHRFAFILADLGNPAFIALAMNRVNRSLDNKLQGDSGLPGVDVKIGLAINRHGAGESMTMFAEAEASLSHVKLGGVQRIEDVLAGDKSETAQLQLQRSMAEAMQENAFDLHFQPKIELATGRPCGVEALLRWQAPNGEQVSPELISEWAEVSGRSYELTKWVVHRALRQLRQWQDFPDISVAVNVPATLAGDPDLPALLEDAIAIWGVAPRRVTVELTERAIIEDKQSGFDNLQRLREMGVNISIDDFGTGYSSLSYFKHIPAGELKIDKSFIDSMLVNEQDLELVKIIIHLAHRFGLLVVAEGVEDGASLDTLRALGCDYVQGFHISRPLPAEALAPWLANWGGLDA